MTALVSGPADAAEAPRRSIASRLPATGTVFALGIAMVFYLIALSSIEQDDMNGFGLVSVLPWTFFVAVIILAVQAGYLLSRQEVRDPDLALLTICVIVVLFTVQNLSDSAAGFPTGWLHSGFAGYIAENGEVLLGYDARFSWPAFFATAAAVADMAGLPDTLPFLLLSPLFYNLLLFLPMLLLVRRVSTRRELGWLAILVYYCANWFEQDYFAPQATNIVMYLCVVALLMWLASGGTQEYERPLRRRLRAWRLDGVAVSMRRLTHAVLFMRPPRLAGMTGFQYVGLLIALVVVISGIVVSHQLTPVVLIIALTAFSFTTRTRFKGLWMIAAVIFVGWFSYGATDFWIGHLSTVIGDVGEVGSTLNSGVANRVVGDPEHRMMQQLRLLESAALAGLAVVGILSRRRSSFVLLYAALAFGPFILLGLQSYGGEVVIRCFLFASPMMAVLAAEALRPVWLLPRRWAWAALAAIVLAGLVVNVAARGANQPFHRVTSDEVEAVKVVQQAARTGAVVGVLNDFSPVGLIPPGSVDLTALDEDDCLDDIVGCAAERQIEYLVVTSGQDAYGRLKEGRPDGWADDVVRSLLATGNYAVIWESEHATALRYTGPVVVDTP